MNGFTLSIIYPLRNKHVIPINQRVHASPKEQIKVLVGHGRCSPIIPKIIQMLQFWFVLLNFKQGCRWGGLALISEFCSLVWIYWLVQSTIRTLLVAPGSSTLLGADTRVIPHRVKSSSIMDTSDSKPLPTNSQLLVCHPLVDNHTSYVDNQHPTHRKSKFDGLRVWPGSLMYFNNWTVPKYGWWDIYI